MPQAKAGRGTVPPEPAKRSGVKFYRSIDGRYSWEVTVLAEDDSESALRRAKALAIELSNEFAEQLRERKQRGKQPQQ
jgi:hypothetical protein